MYEQRIGYDVKLRFPVNRVSNGVTYCAPL